MNQLAEQRIINRASAMVQRSGISVIEAVHKAMMIHALTYAIQDKGVVVVKFKKKSGEVVERHATRYENVMNENIIGNGTPRKYYGLFCFWDVMQNRFSSFRYENLISFQ